MGKTVLVTAIGSFSAEAVVRGYKKMGFRVLGCDIYPPEWVAASLEVDGFFQAPIAEDREAYLDFISRVCRDGRVDYLVPLTDAEVDVINECRGAVGASVCLSPPRTVSLCRNKWEMWNFLEKHEICPAVPTRRLTEVLHSEEDTGYELLPYPAVLKPYNGRSSQGLAVVWDARQMRIEMERLSNMTDFYLFQPRIPGYIVTVDVVRSPKTGQVICLPRRELLRTCNGAGTSVCVFRSEKLEAGCEVLARALDVTGCVNFEFVEADVGNWFFMECNPRFSGGVAFSAAAGYDMVANHMRCFTGERLDSLENVGERYLVKRYTEICTKKEAL